MRLLKSIIDKKEEENELFICYFSLKKDSKAGNHEEKLRGNFILGEFVVHIPTIIKEELKIEPKNMYIKNDIVYFEDDFNTYELELNIFVYDVEKTSEIVKKIYEKL